MPSKIKLSDAIALKVVAEESAKLEDDAAAIQAEFQAHKDELDSALAFHTEVRDKKLAALAEIRARHAQVAVDTGVDVSTVASVDLAKGEVTTKAEVAAAKAALVAAEAEEVKP